MNKNEQRKLSAKIKRWDKVSSEINPAWTSFWKAVGKRIRIEKENMIYGKKPKNRVDRFTYELAWWFKLIIIFMAFSYLAGR